MLIADDERIIREAVGEVIDWAGMGVQIVGLCKNGLEALDAIMDTAPDIVMTDIRMPGMDGLELIGKIRQLDSRVQFIILSGYQEFEYARRAMRYGVREYLLKPINEEQLVAAVQRSRQNVIDTRTPVENLVEQLLHARDARDREGAGELLDRFFQPVREHEQCRALGVNLIARLLSRLDLTDGESLLRFTEALVTRQELGSLVGVVRGQALTLLFAPRRENRSLADSVKDCVERNLGDANLSLKFIAEQRLYLNVDYLSRAFTAQAGEKFSSYLNRTRVERAKGLLLQLGPGSVHKVAEAVGCGNNPQYFSQVFKKYTGVTPSQFLESGAGG